ncbi:MAG: MFS transporter [Verrucomicrobia bacterium]|nr:MFS transporter [Verrucomicrobiota bacterium]
MPTIPLTASVTEDDVYNKVAWRTIPLLFLCYIAAYLDRVNVGFAKLQMQADVVDISDSVFGFGAGIFFLGYFIFEVPSNVLMEKVGARLWIARIMITWGIISCAMIFVNSKWVFYGLRLLLGLAEAGFFPGIILYLTYWFPSRRRGRAVALFMLAIALTGVIGGPLSGWILQACNGVAGLRGWQMLFLLEGIPSILLGLLIPFLLANRVRSAHWLNDEEKQLLEENLKAEEAHKKHLPLLRVFFDPKLLLFSLVYFCCVMGLYGTGFWIPQLIKNTGVKDPLYVGLLTAIPYGFGAIAMLVFGRSSDRYGERRWHFAVASILGAVGIVISNLFRQDTLIAMIGLTLATIGILAAFPVFWPMPTAVLAGTAAAAGIAWINSLGNLAGFFGPSIVGWFADLTKRSDYGLYVIAGILVLGAILVLAFVPPRVVADIDRS